MKISQDEAEILARVFERYTIDAENYIKNNFRDHKEFPINKNLLLELVQELTLLAKIYPHLNHNQYLATAIGIRLSTYESRTRVIEEPTINHLEDTNEIVHSLPTSEEEFISLLTGSKG